LFLPSHSSFLPTLPSLPPFHVSHSSVSASARLFLALLMPRARARRSICILRGFLYSAAQNSHGLLFVSQHARPPSLIIYLYFSTNPYLSANLHFSTNPYLSANLYFFTNPYLSANLHFSTNPYLSTNLHFSTNPYLSANLHFSTNPYLSTNLHFSTNLNSTPTSISRPPSRFLPTSASLPT
ncbi:hypothetical protein FHG87_008538, partial [Trinorchestia longiramus]